jgi:hypothetical protein
MPDPQSFDRLAAEYDRYASLEPPLALDWLLSQLPDRFPSQGELRLPRL